MALGKYSEALRALNTCRALRKDEPWANAVRSLTLALNGNESEALRELDHLVEESPDFPPGRLIRGYAYLLRNEPDRALAEFDSVMRLPERQRLSGAAYYRSRIFEERGDLQAALRDLDGIIDTDPTFMLAYLSRARLLTKLDQDEKAIGDLDSFISLTDDKIDGDSRKLWRCGNATAHRPSSSRISCGKRMRSGRYDPFLASPICCKHMPVVTMGHRANPRSTIAPHTDVGPYHD